MENSYHDIIEVDNVRQRVTLDTSLCNPLQRFLKYVSNKDHGGVEGRRGCSVLLIINYYQLLLIIIHYYSLLIIIDNHY